MQYRYILSALAASAYVGNVVARPIQHQHNVHDKRDVVVVTQTQIVTVGGSAQTVQDVHPASSVSRSQYTSAPQVVPTSTASPAETTAAETSEASSTEVSTTAEETSTSASSTSSTSAAETSSSGSFNANLKGITYSPYSDNGGCKSADEVASDMEKLGEYGLVRLYGTDCNQVENVFKAKADGQKLFLGIFEVNAIEQCVSTIKSAVESYGSWDDVHTVSVGNELVNSGQATPSQIKDYVNSARSALTSAGYSGKVVSVDTFIAVINNPELCEYSDYMAVNGHAFFDGFIEASGSGDWALLQLQRVWSACNGKQDVLIAESGWPSKGDSNNVAVPSKSNQKAAMDSISEKCGDSVIGFNAFNDMWKQPGPFNAEQYWGILSN